MNIKRDFLYDFDNVVKMEQKNLLRLFPVFLFFTLILLFLIVYNMFAATRYSLLSSLLIFCIFIIFPIRYLSMKATLKKLFTQVPMYQEGQTIEITEDTFCQKSTSKTTLLKWDAFSNIVFYSTHVTFFLKGSSSGFTVPSSIFYDEELAALKKILASKSTYKHFVRTSRM